MVKRQKPEIAHIYEGAPLLTALLHASGSKLDADQVKALLKQAIKDQAAPAEAFPSLWEGEPRFASPLDAARLYGNLFGLWDLLAGGRDPEARLRAEPRPPKRAPAAKPEAPPGGKVSAELVEQGWRYLEDLPDRERRRLRDRFENSQPDLNEFVMASEELSESAAANAGALAFEVWAMLDIAREGKVPAPDFDDLRELKLEEALPKAPSALVAYVDESLTEAELDDTDPLNREERKKLELLLRKAICALSAPLST